MMLIERPGIIVQRGSAEERLANATMRTTTTVSWRVTGGF
jgi:hypothetical protein